MLQLRLVVFLFASELRAGELRGLESDDTEIVGQLLAETYVPERTSCNVELRQIPGLQVFSLSGHVAEPVLTSLLLHHLLCARQVQRRLHQIAQRC